MRKILLAFLLLCASSFASPPGGTTTQVTARLADPGNVVVTSRTFLRVELKNTGGQQCKVGGTQVITPYIKDFSPDSNGNVSATLQKNSAITCGTSTGNTRYGFTIWRDGKPQPTCDLQISAATDLSTASCLNAAPTPVTTLPTDSIYARVDGTNAGFTGPITSPEFNNICFANVQMGTDEGAKISSCVDFLGANGGTIDARGILGAQTSAANPFATQLGPITLWLGHGTITTSASWAPQISGTEIIGAGRTLTTIKAATNLNSRVINVSGVNNFGIRNLTIDGNKANQSGSPTVDGIHVTNSTTFRCSNLLVQNTKNYGYFFETGFSDVEFDGCSADGPNVGSGALFGNGTGTSGSHIRVRGGYFNNSTTANGLFTTGVITDFKATNFEARLNADTGVEIGDGTIGFEVSNCFVDPTSTGIILRSSQNGSLTNCQVTPSVPANGQIGIYAWNNTGDSQPFKNLAIESNVVVGLTSPSSSDIAWSSVSGSSANLSVKGNVTGTADTKRYDPKTTNITPLVLDQDDGNISHNAADLTFTPQTAGFVHFIASGAGKVGIGATSFTPSSPLHIQDGNGADSATFEDTSNANKTILWKNSSQSWRCGIRATSGGLVTSNESFVCRDGTNSVDVLAIAPSTGATQLIGTVNKYNNVAVQTGSIGLNNYGYVSQANKVAAIGTTTIITSVAADTLYVVEGEIACHTSSASATVNITIGWTDISNTAQTSSTANINCTTLGASSRIAVFAAFSAKASTNITYATAIANTPTYDVRLVVRQMGTN